MKSNTLDEYTLALLLRILQKEEKIVMLRKLYNPSRRDASYLMQIIRDQEIDICNLREIKGVLIKHEKIFRRSDI